MFGLLKNKLSNFSKKLKEKVTKKEETPLPKELPEEGIEEPISEEVEETVTEEKPVVDEPIVEEQVEEPKEEIIEETEEQIEEQPVEEETAEEVKGEEPIEEVTEPVPEPEPEPEPEEEIEPEVQPEAEPVPEPEPEPEPKREEPEIEEKPEPVQEVEEEIVPEEVEPEPEVVPEPAKKPSIEKRELKTKIKARSKITSVFKRYVELRESDLTDLLFELELSLLEADVNQDSAKAICEKIKTDLVGKKIPKGEDFDTFIQEEIKKILAEVMQTEKIDLLQKISEKKEKPFVILFLGPNGAGKTTSISKLTQFLQNNKLQVIWSASDTFRAAAIEQLEKHASKLKTRVVKHTYGSDPAAVAFDAIEAAKAANIDVVLIDSAGRQETNKNLMGELQKIARIAKPDLKIFVGEALAGKSLLDQAHSYNEFLPLDGFILTKIDTDAKGGTAISLLHELKKPILYIGTGQEYKDFQEFTSEYILDRIV